MTVTEDNMRAALDLKNLPQPPDLHVRKIDAEDYTDWTGDPALRITVILDESVEIEKLSGETIGDFKSGIRESLRKHGINLFAYIFLVKESELKETDEE